MTVKIHRHAWQYLILFFILTAGFATFISVRGNILHQFFVGLGIAIVYVAWGVFHHVLERDFNWKIMVEYSVLAVFAVSVLGAFLFLR